MKLDRTRKHLESFEKKDTLELSDVVGFYYDLAEDLESSEIYVDELSIGKVEAYDRTLPWLGLFVKDTYEMVRDAMSSSRGKEELEELLQRMEELQSELDEFMKGAKEREIIRERVTEGEKNLEKEKQEAEEMRSRKAHLEIELLQLNSDKQKLDVRVTQLREQVSGIEQDIKKKNQEAALVEDQCGAKRDELLGKQAEINGQNDRLRKLTDEIENLKLQWNNASLSLQSAQQNKGQLENRILDARTKCAELQKDLDEKIRTLGIVNEECEKLRHQIRVKEEELDRGEAEKLQQELEDVESSLRMQMEACEQTRESIRLAKIELEEQEKQQKSLELYHAYFTNEMGLTKDQRSRLNI